MGELKCFNKALGGLGLLWLLVAGGCSLNQSKYLNLIVLLFHRKATYSECNF